MSAFDDVTNSELKDTAEVFVMLHDLIKLNKLAIEGALLLPKEVIVMQLRDTTEMIELIFTASQMVLETEMVTRNLDSD